MELPSKVGGRAGLPIKAAIALILTFMVLFTLIAGALIYQGYRDTEIRAAETATSAAQAVAINTGWIVEVAGQALQRMDSALGANPEDRATNAYSEIRDALNGLPVGAKAYIYTPDGKPLFSTDPELPTTDVREWEQFTEPASGKKFHTSALQVDTNDDQTFSFSRRVDRRGEFAGVAVISFRVSLLTSLWTALDLDAGSAISIVREDGMLVARYPFADGPVDLSEHAMFTEHLPQSREGTYSSAASPVDGVPRVVGFRGVDGTELIAVASIDRAEILARFWRNVLVFLALVVPVLLALAGAAFWIIRLLQRDLLRQAELSLALETNTMLFREIHHRVKNNLQSMHSLVRMQNLSPAAKTDLQSRFVAMAAVHEHMYQHDAYAQLDAPTFIASVATPVIQAYGSQAALELDIDPIGISHDQATPLALLINEVMTNSLKYAFGGRTDGIIRVSLKSRPEGGEALVIADNGSGFVMGRVSSGMGSRLIKGVVSQLGGSFSYRFESGTVFSAELNLVQQGEPARAHG